MTTNENTNPSEICELFQNQDEFKKENNKLKLIKDKKSTKKRLNELLEGSNEFNNIKYYFNNDNININETKKQLIKECKEREAFIGFSNILKSGLISNDYNSKGKINFKYIKNINYLLFIPDLDEDEKPIEKKYLDDIKEYYLKYNKNPFILSAIGGYCFKNDDNIYCPMVENTQIFGFKSINNIFYNLFYKCIKNLNQNSILIIKSNDNFKHNIYNFLNFSNYQKLRIQFNDFKEDKGENCGTLKNIFFEPSKMNFKKEVIKKEVINNDLEYIKKPLKKLKKINIDDLPDDILKYIRYEIPKIEKKNIEYKFKIKRNIINLDYFLCSYNFRHILEYNLSIKRAIKDYEDLKEYEKRYYIKKQKDRIKILNDDIKKIDYKRYERYFLRNSISQSFINEHNYNNFETYRGYLIEEDNEDYNIDEFYIYSLNLRATIQSTIGARLAKYAKIRGKELFNMRLIPKYTDLNEWFLI
jgi:hypothetical protein